MDQNISLMREGIKQHVLLPKVIGVFHVGKTLLRISAFFKNTCKTHVYVRGLCVLMRERFDGGDRLVKIGISCLSVPPPVFNES